MPRLWSFCGMDTRVALVEMGCWLCRDPVWLCAFLVVLRAARASL